jgi:hypothetical protein
MLQRVCMNYGFGGLTFYDIEAEDAEEATEMMLSAVHGGDYDSAMWLESCRVENPSGKGLPREEERQEPRVPGQSKWCCEMARADFAVNTPGAPALRRKIGKRIVCSCGQGWLLDEVLAPPEIPFGVRLMWVKSSVKGQAE